MLTEATDNKPHLNFLQSVNTYTKKDKKISFFIIYVVLLAVIPVVLTQWGCTAFK